MSEHGHAAPVPLNEAFDPKEIESFDSDDTQAGRAIGKMLSWFFLYTIIVMSLAAYWTYRSISG